jgi:hypothetical protein
MAGKSGPDISENGLVLYLDAANKASYPGSGTAWKDLSGNNYTGTLTNGPTYSATNLGNIVFDGVDDYVVWNSLVWNYNNPFTVSFWFNLNSLGDPVYGWGFFFCGTTSSNVNRVQIGGRGDGSIYLYAETTTVNDTYSSSASFVTTNTWYNFTITRISNTITLYLNGNSFTSGAVTYSPSLSNNLYMGILRSNNALRYLNGKMANTLIYNRGLSTTEVLQNYNAVKSRFGY